MKQQAKILKYLQKKYLGKSFAVYPYQTNSFYIITDLMLNKKDLFIWYQIHINQQLVEEKYGFIMDWEYLMSVYFEIKKVRFFESSTILT